MKGMLQTRGIRNIKSPSSIGARSIPHVQRSSYLELYVLGSKKDRLEKEICALDKRRNTAQKQLDNVCRQMERLRKETHEAQKGASAGSTPAKALKTMAMDY